MAMIKFMSPTAQVCKLDTLVKLLYIPPFEILFLIVFHMSLKPQKNLISVHKLAADNNVFLEFHPDFFLVKD